MCGKLAVSANMCPESKTNGKIRCEPSLRLKKNMLEAGAVIPNLRLFR